MIDKEIMNYVITLIVLNDFIFLTFTIICLILSDSKKESGK